MGREGCSAHSGGHRRVPSSLTTDKVPSVGAHHAASVSQEAPLSFIYYLFNLVAAPTSATCYKKRSKAGFGAPPAASVRRGGKRKVLSWPPPHTGRAPAKGSGGGAGTALPGLSLFPLVRDANEGKKSIKTLCFEVFFCHVTPGRPKGPRQPKEHPPQQLGSAPQLLKLQAWFQKEQVFFKQLWK